jgi:glutamate-5-semialdehyde dehydrogenase
VLAKWASGREAGCAVGGGGAIYESRPNVTFDIAALCLRSRNGCLLKGSQEAAETNKAAMVLIRKALKAEGCHRTVWCCCRRSGRWWQELLTATRWVDVIIPRGSEALIRYVRANSLVPVIETGAGVCHVYVEKEADLEMAVRIVVNAKVSRPSVCNAMDTLIVDRGCSCAVAAASGAVGKIWGRGFCGSSGMRILRGYPLLREASEEDFAREWLSLKCAVKVVKGMDEALAHIERYSTRHSEAIVSGIRRSVSGSWRRWMPRRSMRMPARVLRMGRNWGLGRR